MPTETATREALLALADALDADADAHEAAGRRDAATRWRRDADEARARAEGAPPTPPRIDASEIIDEAKEVIDGLRLAGQGLMDGAAKMAAHLDEILADRVAAALEAQAAQEAVVEQPVSPETTPAEVTLGAPDEPAPPDETPAPDAPAPETANEGPDADVAEGQAGPQEPSTDAPNPAVPAAESAPPEQAGDGGGASVSPPLADDSAVIPPETVEAEVVADPAAAPAETWPEDGNAAGPAPEVTP